MSDADSSCLRGDDGAVAIADLRVTVPVCSSNIGIGVGLRSRGSDSIHRQGGRADTFPLSRSMRARASG